MWDDVLSAVRGEFGDLDAARFAQVAVRLLLSMAFAAAIGYERELRSSAAGLRTHMMVALGVALVVVAADQSGFGADAMSRVAQGILVGIGFLGAGAILKQSEREHIKGLTTASSIWATAGIALTAGLGRETTALLATILALVILESLYRLERRHSAADEEDGPAR